MSGTSGQVRERGIGSERTGALRVPLCRRAEPQRFGAFDDEQANRTVTLQLHDEAPRELERRCKQRRRSDKLREDALQWRRIAMTGEDRARGIGQRNERAAYGGVLEHEPGEHIGHRRAAPR